MVTIIPKWKATKITDLALWTPTLAEEQPPTEGPGPEEVIGTEGAEPQAGGAGHPAHLHRWAPWDVACGPRGVQDIQLPSGSRGGEDRIQGTEECPVDMRASAARWFLSS